MEHPKRAGELRSLFKLGWKNRECVEGEYGPPRVNATAVLQLDIVQVQTSRTPNGRHVAKVHSRFLCLDVAGTEKLAEDPAALRLSEPPALSRSIFGLLAVAKVLSSPTVNFTPYERSQLTRLTQEALGGNCVTVVVACLVQGSGKSNSMTMNLVQMLQHIQTYPVRVRRGGVRACVACRRMPSVPCRAVPCVRACVGA